MKSFLLLAFTIYLFAPLHSMGQKRTALKRPTAVLVQLKSEQNRIEYLNNARKFDDLAVFKQDVIGVMTATIQDFSKNFNYCPVYYFMDTNTASVLAQDFAGVLLNADLSPAKDIAITDSNFMIAYYGFPDWQTNKKKWDTTRADHWAGGPNGRGLILNDYKLRQVAYLYKLDMDFFNYKNKTKYTSKKFNIEYYPFAAEFNRSLKITSTKNIRNKNKKNKPQE